MNILILQPTAQHAMTTTTALLMTSARPASVLAYLRRVAIKMCHAVTRRSASTMVLTAHLASIARRRRAVVHAQLPTWYSEKRVKLKYIGKQRYCV
jgi:hypothetical protein